MFATRGLSHLTIQRTIKCELGTDGPGPPCGSSEPEAGFIYVVAESSLKGDQDLIAGTHSAHTTLREANQAARDFLENSLHDPWVTFVVTEWSDGTEHICTMEEDQTKRHTQVYRAELFGDFEAWTRARR